MFWLTAMALLCFPLSCTEAISHDGSVGKSNREAVRLNYEYISHAKSLLQDGDLVLRTGKDFISLTLRQFSVHDKTYSHCGIVRIENGRPYVYHAIGGEDNPDAKLRRDSFEAFCNPQYNLGFGIYRYKLTPIQLHRLDSLTDRFYRERIPFDMKFDLSTDSSFYCAEFVYKVIERATDKKEFLKTSHIGNFTYVAIDNLFLTPNAKPVYRVVFR